MANDFYKEDWKTFLKCKECNIFKEINNNNRYSHKDGFLWVLWRCKECIKAGRKTEHELSMAREREKRRYYNNPERRLYIFKAWAERRKRKWYWNIHNKTERLIRKIKARPSKCPICNCEGRIIAHHPDYNKRYEVVFCCQICHGKIHKQKITDYKIVNLLDIDSKTPFMSQ